MSSRRGAGSARDRRAPSVCNGIRLSPEVYDLFQVDVDGAALQAVSFSTTIEALKNPEKRSEASPDEAGLPRCDPPAWPSPGSSAATSC